MRINKGQRMQRVQSHRLNMLCLALICTLPWVAAGQEDLPSEEIEVIKDFEARLIDARKLQIRPMVDNVDTMTKKYVYTVTPLSPRINYEAPPIKPLAMRSERQPEHYNGYVKAGYGFPNAPYGELGYHLLTREDASLAFRARHLSAENKDLQYQKFMDNDASLAGTYTFSNALALSGDLSFSLDDIYYYGYDHENPPIILDVIRRRYNTLAFSARAENSARLAGDFNYFADVSAYRHADDLDARETGLRLHLGGEKWIAEKHPAGLQVITDLSTLNDTAKRQINNFFIVPHFTFRGDQYKVRLAANIASHDEVFTLFPQIEGSYKVLGNHLIALAGVDGGLEKNNFRTLSEFNPFIGPLIRSIRNTQFRDYYAGVRGTYRIFEYSGKVGYRTMQDLALFVPEADDPRKFQPLYDDVQVLYLEAVIRAKPATGLDVGLTLTQQFFNPDREEKAWQLPGFSANLFAAYHTPDQRLRLRSELFIQSAVNVPGEDGGTEKLNSLFDLSLGVDYFITEKIGLFANVNNLAGIKYQRWLEYPTYGINAVAGAQVRF